MKDCVTNIRWRILKETAHEFQEDQRTLLPFWFFGVYETQTNIQMEAKIKIDFKLLGLAEVLRVVSRLSR